MKRISVVIPTYEMKGLGAGFLRQSFDILARQSFKDFDVVVSDHSKTDVIERVCNEYRDRLDIAYFRNADKIGNSPANTNNAIRKSTGELIKILFQDDFLRSDDALAKISAAFDADKDGWLVTACDHTADGSTFFRDFHPRYNDKIHLGRNTISSPSVVTIRNREPILFDEGLVWSMDCDYYKRCHDRFGGPKILDEVLVTNRVGAHQISSAPAEDAARDAEHLYMLRKYREPLPGLRMALRKARRSIRRFAGSVIKQIISPSP